MFKTKHDWSYVAREEPYFGVLANEKYRTSNITGGSIEEFYKSGENDIHRIRVLCNDVFKIMPKGRVLDFGCGVGRHTLAISKVSEHVTGYDISQEMLDIAQTRASTKNITNVAFENRLPKGPFDWINSYIVFQHIPPKEGYFLFEEIVSRSSESAALTIYIPFWSEANVRASKNILSHLVTNLIRAQARYGRKPAETLIQMHTYELSRIVKIANIAGFKDIYLKHENHGGFYGAWVIAKK
ncbi:MAG: class I SAM-dependent methyltransferase [Pseudomonadota bacterium]